ncbi:hypothetical protein KP509_08G023800 [Ceratopteris richardii]|uniref:Tripeptidyl peptidase II second Ig-like domain-containing protein n=1 Tax=Ceratopteris richardii TaxID=49495 RepID=A0A8T2UB30_CERRI|nr:hypothetical protein KP509_08G023800 [Ceratopteris richardii]
MITDLNKRVLAVGDVYPKGVRLSNGDYVLRLHLRHENMEYLEKLKKTVIYIDKSLEEKNYIRLPFFSCIDGAITGRFGFKSRTLLHSESTTLYIGSPSEEKLPKDPTVGTMLLGKLTYGKIHSYNNKNDKNGQPCPASYPLRCVVPPPSKNDERQKDEDVSKKTNAEGFEEQVRDAKVLASLSRASAEE